MRRTLIVAVGAALLLSFAAWAVLTPVIPGPFNPEALRAILSGHRAPGEYVPLAIRLAPELRQLGINASPLPPNLPIAQFPMPKKADAGSGTRNPNQWVYDTLCYPNSPVHDIPDKFLTGLSQGLVEAGKLSDTQTRSAEFQAVYRDILTLSVRRIDIWASSEDSICHDGEWVGSGTAFAFYAGKDQDGQWIEAWATADHVLFLQDYAQVDMVTHLRVDGVDVIPLPRQPDYRLGIVVSPDRVLNFPLNWYIFGGDPQLDFIADRWEVGQYVYIPFYTLSELCLPKDYEDLFRNCITELMMVDKGTIASTEDIAGKLGGGITITSNLIAGSSGAPYMLFDPHGNGPFNGNSFKVLAVENSGFSSGIALGQRFTKRDYQAVVKAIGDLRKVWLKPPQTGSQKP